jgi:hypothetical protein
MKRILGKIFILLVLLLTLTFAGTWKNKNFPGPAFPYIGGLLCHDGDYVEFSVFPEQNGFYYMTHYDREVNLEPYFWKVDPKDNKEKWMGLGTVITLPSNPYTVGDHFSNASWRWVSLGQGYVGKTIQLRLVENRTVNKHYCPSNDIIIKFKSNIQVMNWKGVDSESWCDLDEVAR